MTNVYFVYNIVNVLTHPPILAHPQQERKYKKIRLFFWNSVRRCRAIIFYF